MILATQTLNGRIQYVDAFSGNRVYLERMLGHGQNRLPDYAFRFLTPAPKVNNVVSPLSMGELTTRSKRRNMGIQNNQQVNVRLSWFKQVIQWIKNRF